MLQQIGASHLHKPAAESHNSRTAGGASEGPFSAITQALICVVTKEILVLASVILFIYLLLEFCNFLVPNWQGYTNLLKL